MKFSEKSKAFLDQLIQVPEPRADLNLSPEEIPVYKSLIKKIKIHALHSFMSLKLDFIFEAVFERAETYGNLSKSFNILTLLSADKERLQEAFALDSKEYLKMVRRTDGSFKEQKNENFKDKLLFDLLNKKEDEYQQWHQMVHGVFLDKPSYSKENVHAFAQSLSYDLLAPGHSHIAASFKQNNSGLTAEEWKLCNRIYNVAELKDNKIKRRNAHLDIMLSIQEIQTLVFACSKRIQDNVKAYQVENKIADNSQLPEGTLSENKCKALFYDNVLTDDDCKYLSLTEAENDFMESYTNKSFINAVKAKDKHKIIELFSKNNSVLNRKDYHDGMTPLAWAVCTGDLDMVEFLLDMGAIANTQNRQGYSPLHFSVEQKDSRILKRLLKEKDVQANVNVVDEGNYSPLYIAAEIGDVEKVIALLKCKADPNLKGKTGKYCNAVEIAIYRGHADVLQAIVENSIIPRNNTLTNKDNQNIYQQVLSHTNEEFKKKAIKILGIPVASSNATQQTPMKAPSKSSKQQPLMSAPSKGTQQSPINNSNTGTQRPPLNPKFLEIVKLQQTMMIQNGMLTPTMQSPISQMVTQPALTKASTPVLPKITTQPVLPKPISTPIPVSVPVPVPTTTPAPAMTMTQAVNGLQSARKLTIDTKNMFLKYLQNPQLIDINKDALYESMSKVTHNPFEDEFYIAPPPSNLTYNGKNEYYRTEKMRIRDEYIELKHKVEVLKHSGQRKTYPFIQRYNDAYNAFKQAEKAGLNTNLIAFEFLRADMQVNLNANEVLVTDLSYMLLLISQDKTPLQEAIKADEPKTIKLILERNPQAYFEPITYRNKKLTPIEYAIECGKVVATEALLNVIANNKELKQKVQVSENVLTKVQQQKNIIAQEKPSHAELKDAFSIDVDFKEISRHNFEKIIKNVYENNMKRGLNYQNLVNGLWTTDEYKLISSIVNGSKKEKMSALRNKMQMAMEKEGKVVKKSQLKVDASLKNSKYKSQHSIPLVAKHATSEKARQKIEETGKLMTVENVLEANLATKSTTPLDQRKVIFSSLPSPTNTITPIADHHPNVIVIDLNKSIISGLIKQDDIFTSPHLAAFKIERIETPIIFQGTDPSIKTIYRVYHCSNKETGRYSKVHSFHYYKNDKIIGSHVEINTLEDEINVGDPAKRIAYDLAWKLRMINGPFEKDGGAYGHYVRENTHDANVVNAALAALYNVFNIECKFEQDINVKQGQKEGSVRIEKNSVANVPRYSNRNDKYLLPDMDRVYLTSVINSCNNYSKDDANYPQILQQFKNYIEVTKKIHPLQLNEVLQCAIEHKQLDFVDYLLNYGVNPAYEKSRVLFIAIRDLKLEYMKAVPNEEDIEKLVSIIKKLILVGGRNEHYPDAIKTTDVQHISYGANCDDFHLNLLEWATLKQESIENIVSALLIIKNEEFTQIFIDNLNRYLPEVYEITAKLGQEELHAKIAERLNKPNLLSEQNVNKLLNRTDELSSLDQTILYASARKNENTKLLKQYIFDKSYKMSVNDYLINLHYALEENNFDYVKTMLRACYNVTGNELKDIITRSLQYLKESIFYAAVKHGDMEIIDFMLTASPSAGKGVEYCLQFQRYDLLPFFIEKKMEKEITFETKLPNVARSKSIKSVIDFIKTTLINDKKAVLIAFNYFYNYLSTFTETDERGVIHGSLTNKLTDEQLKNTLVFDLIAIIKSTNNVQLAQDFISQLFSEGENQYLTKELKQEIIDKLFSDPEYNIYQELYVEAPDIFKVVYSEFVKHSPENLVLASVKTHNALAIAMQSKNPNALFDNGKFDILKKSYTLDSISLAIINCQNTDTVDTMINAIDQNYFVNNKTLYKDNSDFYLWISVAMLRGDMKLLQWIFERVCVPCNFTPSFEELMRIACLRYQDIYKSFVNNVSIKESLVTNFEKSLSFLKEKGIDFKSTTTKPLFVTAYDNYTLSNSNKEISFALFQALVNFPDSDIGNAKTNLGNTLLHCVENQSLTESLVTQFIARGGDINAKNNFGVTSLEMLYHKQAGKLSYAKNDTKKAKEKGIVPTILPNIESESSVDTKGFDVLKAHGATARPLYSQYKQDDFRVVFATIGNKLYLLQGAQGGFIHHSEGEVLQTLVKDKKTATKSFVNVIEGADVEFSYLHLNLSKYLDSKAKSPSKLLEPNHVLPDMHPDCKWVEYETINKEELSPAAKECINLGLTHMHLVSETVNQQDMAAKLAGEAGYAQSFIEAIIRDDVNFLEPLMTEKFDRALLSNVSLNQLQEVPHAQYVSITSNPIHVAIKANSNKTLQFLLDKGFNANWDDVMYAIFVGNIAAVEKLVNRIIQIPAQCTEKMFEKFISNFKKELTEYQSRLMKYYYAKIKFISPLHVNKNEKAEKLITILQTFVTQMGNFNAKKSYETVVSNLRSELIKKIYFKPMDASDDVMETSEEQGKRKMTDSNMNPNPTKKSKVEEDKINLKRKNSTDDKVDDKILEQRGKKGKTEVNPPVSQHPMTYFGSQSTTAQPGAQPSQRQNQGPSQK